MPNEEGISQYVYELSMSQ